MAEKLTIRRGTQSADLSRARWEPASVATRLTFPVAKTRQQFVSAVATNARDSEPGGGFLDLEKALHFLRTAPHMRADRSSEIKKRMLEMVQIAEKLEVENPSLGPTDLSVNLDKYLYGFD